MTDAQRTAGGLRVLAKAGRQATRTNNRRLILQLLYAGEPLSRADLARRTSLTPATVSTIVSEFVAAGLVGTSGQRRKATQVGKPPTLLELKASARNVIALDLCGNQFRGAVADLAGNLIAQVTLDATDAMGDEAVEKVEAITRMALAKASAPILGIGIGSPGLISPDGVIVKGLHREWRNFAIADYLEHLFGYPTHIGNDANIAAIAEYSRGEHDSTSLAVIKISSGVGAGFVFGGRLYQGEHFAAGEIGHLVVDPEAPPCVCGRNGCLESFLNLDIVAKQLEQPGADREAIRAEAGARLGISLSHLAAILDLKQVFVSCPEEVFGPDFCSHAEAEIHRRCLARSADSVSVRYTTVGDEIVLLGAAGLVISEELGVV